MRILHCIATASEGGAERQLAYLSSELADLGVEVHVALLKVKGSNLERLQRSSVPVHAIAHLGHRDPSIVFRLARLIRRLRPDLVQTWLPFMDVAGGIASQLRGVPWVLSERASAEAYPASIVYRLRSRLGRRADAVVSNSLAGDRYWKDGGLPARARFVIANGLPLDEIEAQPPASREVVGVSPGQRLLLCIGRLVPQKNLPTLIRALEAIPPAAGVRALLYGEGPQRGSLERLIENAGLRGRVQLPGHTPDVWGLMKSADLFVSVSVFDGHPNAVMEAMACGCPLVVSDIPAHREMLDEGMALFADPNQPEAIASAIRSVLESPAAAAARARVARRRALDWTTGAMARRYLAVYEQVLASA